MHVRQSIATALAEMPPQFRWRAVRARNSLLARLCARPPRAHPCHILQPFPSTLSLCFLPWFPVAPSLLIYLSIFTAHCIYVAIHSLQHDIADIIARTSTSLPPLEHIGRTIFPQGNIQGSPQRKVPRQQAETLPRKPVERHSDRDMTSLGFEPQPY
ncbi:hypothetical protein KC333_g96 [Hortaea werneckii]|nr:hypothetical protein KC333_g96 [Hortaea werneckii]